MVNIFIFKSDNEINQNDLPDIPFCIEIVPTIDFEYINDEQIDYALLNIHEYQGIIITSPRCLTALCKSLERTSSIIPDTCQIYSIAPKTAKLVKQLLNHNIAVEGNNSQELFKKIISSQIKFNVPLLYLKSDKAIDTPLNIFLNANILIKSIVAYKTISHKRLTTFDNSKIQPNVKNFLVFFSPSCCMYSKNIWESLIDSPYVTFVTIGPTTYNYIKSIAPSANTLVSSEPTLNSILDLIKNNIA